MRWSFIVFTFSQKCWNFSTDVLNLRWNLIKIALKFFYFTFSQERWKFITDVFNLCWNFARNALKFYCFHVFSGALKFFYGCGEFGLKLCKKCAEILLLSRFLKSAEICLLMCWICAEILQQMRWNFSADAVNLCWNFARNALKFYCFHVFSRARKIVYWCAEFVLKFCNKCAEIFLRMRWICAETLQEMRWNFIAFTFSQKCWNFSTDVLNLRWNCFILRFLKSSEISLRMCWICAKTL